MQERRLLDRLAELLWPFDLEDAELNRKLEELQRQHRDDVYSELIYLLCHLRFDPGEARNHWDQILSHRVAMESQLGARVDQRVALLSYFVDVNRKLENPKVIEIKLFEQTQASAYRDELTGLCNYRFLREHLEREIHRGERYNAPLSLVMIDVDDFKLYNDHNGHEAGNDALAAIAHLLAEWLRTVDIPARYGGEEFVLLLPSTPKVSAYQVAERTREAIEQYPFPNQNTQPGGNLTVSMGIATFPADAGDGGELVRCADKALYGAKARKKNRVCIYGEDRRSFRRIEAELDGEFCVLAAEYHSLTTLNISQGGLLFLVDMKLPIGALLDIKLIIPGTKRHISASARVIRVEEKESGKFEAAIRLEALPAEDQAALSGYIRMTSLDPEKTPPEERPGVDTRP